MLNNVVYLRHHYTDKANTTMQTFTEIPSRDLIKAEALRIAKPFYPIDTDGFTLPDVILDFLASASDPLDYSKRIHAAHHSYKCHADKGDFAESDFISTMNATYKFLTKE
ncbi:MAG: hypothetical protein CVT94_13810 [Bacteroidetes bacterium HGW-Bacteroidetes-11]|nr:MAG: hypothetical protein CVT94_13810 [Bacteroidetes bacterium HGW-Bacteroidetes-11]